MPSFFKVATQLNAGEFQLICFTVLGAGPATVQVLDL